jgi:antitoxin ParD1/3/4
MPSRRLSREGWQFLPFDAIMRQRRIPMATMNISVPDLMRDFVQRRIDSGRYASVSDYVRDLIRKDQERAEKLSAMQGLVDEGLASGMGERSMDALLRDARKLAAQDMMTPRSAA